MLHEGLDPRLIHVLILTFGEGESICFGSSHNLYRRATLQGGMPVAPQNQFHNSYIFAGHIWPPGFSVCHLDIKNGRFIFGPAGSRVSPTAEFITTAARIFGFSTPQFHHVAILGGRADYQWIYNPGNHNIPLPAPAVLPPYPELPTHGVIGNIRPTTIPVLMNFRLREFQASWGSVNKGLVVAYLGTGQRSQNGRPNSQASILDVTRMPSDYDRYSDSSFRNLMEYLRAVEGNQRRQPGLERGKVLYTSVSDNYFGAVATDGVPANYRLEAFCFEILIAVLRGIGYVHLGSTNLPALTIPGCAGQFQYQLSPEAQEARNTPFQMAASPYVNHRHYGLPCHGELIEFQPVPSEQNPHAIQQARREVYALDAARDIRRHVSRDFIHFSINFLNFQFIFLR